MIKELEVVLNKQVGKLISSRCIVDIMNIMGRATNYQNGNRTAEIALGAEDDEEFFKLKDYNLNKDRSAYGWLSNNSLIVTPDSNFERIVSESKNTGEPGMIFLENIRKYGRIIDGEQFVDQNAMGCEPCSVVTLENYEMAPSVDIYIHNHTSLEEFIETAKYALIYGKTITL
jgi:hypothetical protein